MDLNEIAVQYYHDSLALAQKSLLSGFFVAVVAYFSLKVEKNPSFYTLPIIDIQVASLSYFSGAILVLFLACGFMSSYGIEKALDNWLLISDEEAADRLLHIPSIFFTNNLILSGLFGALLVVGMALVEVIFDIRGSASVWVGFLAVLPYYFAFSRAKEFKNIRKIRVVG